MTPEMNKLRRMLDAEKIEWHDASDKDVQDIYHIDRTHFDYRGYSWSVIHGYGSYGGISSWHDDEGLLEMMSNGANDGDPIGWLNAEEVMEYVRGDRDEVEEEEE